MASPATLGGGECNASSSEERLNLKATELRLGLPGSQSPERDEDHNNNQEPGRFDEKPLFPLLPSSDGICPSLKASGNKRGFLFAMDPFLETRDSKVTEPKDWIFAAPKSDSQTNLKNKHVEAKAQVIGWPPIRSYRKNTLTSTTKVNGEDDGKPGLGPLFVKVSMDGAPYLRKVDLRSYTSYLQLSSGLEKMFSCFTTECVVTYEDKDGDWMLVGDVPWDMFIETCKRLKIMKGSDAIGLAPRPMENSKNSRK